MPPVTVVPRPGGLSRARAPPTAAIQSSSPLSPVPRPVSATRAVAVVVVEDDTPTDGADRARVSVAVVQVRFPPRPQLDARSVQTPTTAGVPLNRTGVSG